MNKRILRILIFLCLPALLLSACTTSGKSAPVTTSAEQPASSETDGTAQPQTSAVSPEDLPAWSETPEDLPTESVPEETPSPETDPIETETRPKSGGSIRVYTDDSQYTPYQPPARIYTRPEGRDLSEFHPENARGFVYPYTTDALYNYEWKSGYHYGFVDSTGTIVTDGVYTGISALYNYDYYTDTPHRLPLWRFSRAENARTVHVEDENYSYDYVDADIVYGVAAMDGSWALPCIYRSIIACEDRIICYKNWEKADFLVYDLQGNVLITSAQLIKKSADSISVEYSEGLYMISYYYNNSGTQHYFCDESGKQVLGPYYNASAFSEGLASVCQSEGSGYGFINKDGAWVISPSFQYASSFRNGRAEVSDALSRSQLIDRSGNVLISCDGNHYLGLNTYGYYVQGSDGYTEYYDRDCNLLYSGNGDWSRMDETRICRRSGTGIQVRDLTTGSDTAVKDLRSLYRSWFVVDGRLEAGFLGYNSEDHYFYVSDDLSEQVDLGPWDAPLAGPIRQASTSLDAVTGETYYMDSQNGLWTFFDAEGNQLCQLRVDDPGIINGRIFSRGGLACTYHSLTGELLFSFPLQGGED